MCSSDDEYSDVWKETIRRARRRHVCEECARGILPGEDYRHVANLYDGHWSTHKTCAHCHTIVVWMRTLCGNVAIGEALREAEEHLGQGYTFGELSLGPRLEMPVDVRRAVLRAVKQGQHGWRRKDGTGLPVPVLPPVPEELRPDALRVRREQAERERYARAARKGTVAQAWI